MAAPLKLAVLISGRGSNLEALIAATQQSDFPARIEVVISNKPDAKGLMKADKAGIPALTIDRKLYVKRSNFEEALTAELKAYNVDLICLAGFMQILSAPFIERWQRRIINIHPSLLPAYKGLDTHRRVLEAGETRSGCTIHYVTPGIDEGPVILQKAVEVRSDDTPEILAARILKIEHQCYPEAIRRIAKFWPDPITLEKEDRS